MIADKTDEIRSRIFVQRDLIVSAGRERNCFAEAFADRNVAIPFGVSLQQLRRCGDTGCFARRCELVSPLHVGPSLFFRAVSFSGIAE